MNQRWKLLAAISILAVSGTYSGCDDSTIQPGPSGEIACKTAEDCPENHRCSDNVCVSNTCETECQTNESCHEGSCYPDYRVCGSELCAEDAICVDGACQSNALEVECDGKCSAEEICFHDTCVKIELVCNDVLCKAGESCINGSCLVPDPCNNSCGDEQKCEEGVCVDKQPTVTDPCAAVYCEDTETCVEGKCVPLCGGKLCSGNEKCVREKCVLPDSCNNDCTEQQVCMDGKCINLSDLCGGILCDPRTVCHESQCVDPCSIVSCGEKYLCLNGECLLKPDSDICEEDCQDGFTCFNKACVDNAQICKGALCPEGQICDASGEYCSMKCDDGRIPCWGSCCGDGYTCSTDVGHCAKDCNAQQVSCNDMWICCDQGYSCAEDYCLIECGNNVRCGERGSEFCCKSGEVCEENKCKIACSGTRCGAEEEFCCDTASELCLYQKCLKRGTSCTDATDCELDEICEETSKTCVSVDADPNACTVKPNAAKFAPRIQWRWPQSLPAKQSAFLPEYNQVMVTPAIINLTDDNNDGKIDENDIPDVIFMSFRKSWTSNGIGVLRAISGDDGHELAATTAEYHADDDPGAADIDGDGKVELIAATKSEIRVFQLVKSASSPTGYTFSIKYKLAHSKGIVVQLDPSFADLDGDGQVEILTSIGVLNVTNGVLGWRSGCNKNLSAPTAADLDGDGKMEIVTGSAIMDDHCNQLVVAGGSGYTAVADLMPDSGAAGELVPEVVHVKSGALQGAIEFWKLYKNGSTWTSKKVWTAPIPLNYARAKSVLNVDCSVASNKTNKACNAGGGPPVIADFNGDGIPDVGVAARWYYIVYSNDGKTGKVLWAHSQTKDYSSAVTGSSVFDFEGDGISEVVYADETRFRVYTGPGSGKDTDGDGYHDPTILYDIPNLSGTLIEYPVVVDVDNDGGTEIVVASNDYTLAGSKAGITVYEDPGGQWVRTRRIWNQHTYHVTNINEDGSVPRHEKVNWLAKRLNNFRQNVQPSGVFVAPNLSSDTFDVNYDNCPTIRLIAKVQNKGSVGIKAGLTVTFYAENANGTGKAGLLGKATVETVIAPGATGRATLNWDGSVTINNSSTTLKLPANIYYIIDEDTSEKPKGEFVECDESDNISEAVPVKNCSGAN